MQLVGNFITEIRYGTSATYILIFINVLVFLLVTFISFLFRGVGQGELATVLGGSAYSLVFFETQWWRVITSTFLHISWWHILLNMITLYSIGGFLENFYSSRKLFIVYVIGGIGGSLVALFDRSAITLGASGAIFALLGLIVGNLLRKNTYSPGLPIKLNSVLYPALFWLILSFGISGISFLGHLGGFITGIALGLVLETANDFSFTTSKKSILNITFTLCVSLVVLSFVFLFINIFFNF